jgi:nucleotide-binding universal stress UspA family protein
MLGGLNWLESLALATGLNARGSTEVIIATVGLSVGALSNQLYTMIVAMAVVTTMIMPPTLRWMMGRVPLRDEELQRLEKEEAEQDESVPKMERALVYVDGSANGALAATLAGLFAARQGVLTTVLQAPGPQSDKDQGRDRLTAAANAALQNTPEPSGKEAPAGAKPALEQLVQGRTAKAEDAVEKEVAKGYGIAFVGIEQPISTTAPGFEDPLQALVETFDGPIAVVMNGRRYHPSSDGPLNILVPTGGSPDARLATEIALALADASHGTLTVLHVFDPREDTLLLRGRARRLGMSVLVDAHRLGKRSGVAVKGLTCTNAQPEIEIRRTARRGGYDLVVLGTALRRGETKFLGPRTLGLVQALRTPVLLIAR